MALTCRRKLLQLADSLGEKVRPQLYEVDISAGSSVGVGTFQANLSEGPFIVTELIDGLGATVAGTVQLSCGGRRYTEGTGVRRAALLQQLTSDEGLPDWMAIDAGGSVQCTVTPDSATVTAGAFIGFAGYHVSPRVHAAAQKLGELWSLLMDLNNDASLQPPITDETRLSMFVRDPIDATYAVTTFDVLFNSDRLSPLGIRNTGMLPSSMWSVGSILSVELDQGSMLSARQVGGVGRSRLSFFGNRHYVR